MNIHYGVQDILYSQSLTFNQRNLELKTQQTKYYLTTKRWDRIQIFQPLPTFNETLYYSRQIQPVVILKPLYYSNLSLNNNYGQCSPINNCYNQIWINRTASPLHYNEKKTFLESRNNSSNKKCQQSFLHNYEQPTVISRQNFDRTNLFNPLALQYQQQFQFQNTMDVHQQIQSKNIDQGYQNISYLQQKGQQRNQFHSSDNYQNQEHPQPQQPIQQQKAQEQEKIKTKEVTKKPVIEKKIPQGENKICEIQQLIPQQQQQNVEPEKKKENEFDFTQKELKQEEQVIPEQAQKSFPEIKKRFQPQQNRNQQCIDQISELYAASQGKRHVDQQYLPFVRYPEDKTELFRNYSIRQSSVKNRLKEICQGYQPVRGDGNCFYTAFGYQFLKILLLKYTNQEYDQFIQFVIDQKIRFRIEYEEFKVDNQQQEHQLLEQFLFLLQEIRIINEEVRLDALFQQFSEYEVKENGQGCLYGLATIFFRNVADYCVEFSEMKEALFDRQNLLIWETECNSNEIVIEALAKQLHLHVLLVFFEQDDFNKQEYYPENKEKIILLIKPGHYNIGLNDE